MSYFTNPYTGKTQLLSGLMGLGTDAASIFGLIKMLTGGKSDGQTAPTPLPQGGTSGPMGGMAANNIMGKMPGPNQMTGPQFSPPTPPIPPSGSPMGMSGANPMAGIPPELMAYLKAMMAQKGGGMMG